MEFLGDLWLPIVLSAVFVFIVSSLLHMVLPIHKGDFAKLPGEDGVLDAMRSAGVRGGDYMFPFPASMKEMGSPEMMEKYNRGPVGWVTVISGPPAIGKSLLQWFSYSIVIGVFVAYITSSALPHGALYLSVFRIAGAVAVLGYAVANVPESIWKGRPWGTTAKFIFDGVLYGLVTAGTFAWLWPPVATAV